MFRQIRSNAAAMVGLLAIFAGAAHAQLTFTPNSPLVFNVPFGSGVSAAQSVTVTAPLVGTFSAINPPADSAWLTIQNNVARTGTNTTVWSFTVNATGLSQGSRSTSLFIFHDTGGFRQLDITLNVGTGSGGTTLIATPAQLNFVTAPNGSSQQQLTVSNVGATIQYTTSSNVPWLTTSPAPSTFITTSSITPITVIVNASQLGGATSGNGTLTLTPVGGGTATQVPVSITVSSANNFQLSETQRTLTYVAGSGSANPSFNVTLTATSAGQTSYNAPTIDYISGGSSSWLSVAPNTAGTTTSNPGVTFVISASASGLAQGTYIGRVNFTSGAVANSPQSVTVTLNVTGTSSLLPSPTSLNFAAQPGSNPTGQTLSVSASTGGAVTFTPTVTYTNPSNPLFNWLTIGNAGVNLTTPSSISVNAITTTGVQTLTAGEYNAVIRLTLTGTATFLDVPVRLNVTNNPIFTVSTSSLTFTGITGSTPASQSFTVQQTPASGNFSAQFIAGPGTPTNIIQAISPSIGALGASASTITVTPSFVGISTGTYSGTIRVATSISTAIGATQDIAVTFNVTTTGGGGGGTGASDFVFPSSLRFFAVNGSSSPLSQALPLASSGLPLNYTLTSQANWLTVTPNQGITPGSPTVTVNPATLPANSTTVGSILIGGTGTTRDGNLIFVQVDTNANPQATVSPSALIFSYVIGSGVQPSGQSIVIGSTTGAALTYTAATTSTGGWLQVSPAAGTTNGQTMVATLNTSALLALTTAGIYDGSIQITTSGGVNNTVVVPVKLILTSSGGGGGGTTLNTLVVSPSSMNFFTPAGVNPLAQNILLVNPSTAPSFSASASTANGGNWLQIQVNPSGIITVSPNAAGLSAGTYTGTVQIISSQFPAGSASVNVSLTVTPTVALVTIPQGMIFSWAGGTSSLPAAQSLTLTSTNGSAVAFTANATTTSGGGWLTVNTGGSNIAPTSISVNANPTGLPAGVYTGTITFSTAGTANPAQSVDVKLIVAGTGTGTGAFQFNPSSLRFFAQPNGAQPPNQQVSVSTTGPVTNYLVTTSVSTPTGGTWLQAGPASGTTPGSISVGVNPFGLSAGTYTGSVTVTGNNQSSTFTVELVITNNPLVVTSTRAINFNHQIGSSVPGPRTIAVTSSNNQTLLYSAAVTSANTPWLQVTQAGSQTPGVFGVSLVPSAVQALAAGTTYQGTITVTANGADNSPLQIPVTLNVSATPQVLLSSNSPVYFDAAFASPAPAAQSLTVNSTSTPLNVTAQSVTTSGGNWLSATLNTAVTPATLTISALSTGLSTGVYNGTVTVTATSGATTSTATIPVVLTVSSQPLLNVTPRELNFGGAGTGTLQQSISITSTLGTASYTVSSAVATPFGGNWLQVNATQTTGATPGNVQISVVPAGLADGTYFGTVTVSATGVANSPIVIPVTLTVNNATALFVSPNDLTFSVQQGGVLPQAQAVSVTSQISTAFTVTTQPGAGTTTANWLDVTPTSGLTNAILTVRPNALAATLTPGRYIAVVTVSGTGSPNTAQFNVTVNVAPSIVLTAAPTSLNFTGRERSTTNPAAQTFTVNAGGAAANIVVTPSTTTGGNWLTVTPATGVTPGTFTVNATIGSLAQGSYTGTIAVALSTAASAPLLQIPVSLTVERAVQPNIVSIANGASFQPGSLSPGLIVSIFGAGLGPDTGLGLQVSGGRVTRTLGGVRVLFDGIEAPLLFVRADQINCVVPYQMQGRAQATVQVDNNGVLSNAITPRIADTAPAIFSLGGTQAAMLNQNGSVNGAGTPADRDSIGVLYMTGEGALTPPGVDGEVTSTIKRPIAPVSIRVGGVEVTNIAFVGAAPGLVQGVTQINFTIPATAPVGSAIPIEVTIGGNRSQANMTIAVR